MVGKTKSLEVALLQKNIFQNKPSETAATSTPSPPRPPPPPPLHTNALIPAGWTNTACGLAANTLLLQHLVDSSTSPSPSRNNPPSTPSPPPPTDRLKPGDMGPDVPAPPEPAPASPAAVAAAEAIAVSVSRTVSTGAPSEDRVDAKTMTGSGGPPPMGIARRLWGRTPAVRVASWRKIGCKTCGEMEAGKEHRSTCVCWG